MVKAMSADWVISSRKKYWLLLWGPHKINCVESDVISDQPTDPQKKSEPPKDFTRTQVKLHGIKYNFIQGQPHVFQMMVWSLWKIYPLALPRNQSIKNCPKILLTNAAAVILHSLIIEIWCSKCFPFFLIHLQSLPPLVDSSVNNTLIKMAPFLNQSFFYRWLTSRIRQW